MKSTKNQTLGAGHALAKHLVGSEDIGHYVEELNLCLKNYNIKTAIIIINSLGPIRFFHVIIAYIASRCNQRY